MASQEYTVSRVISQSETKYPGKFRIAFQTTQTGDRSLSCFTPYPDTVQVGRMVYGEVTEKEVNGSIFYNFTFTKKELGGYASVGSTASASTASVPNPGIDAIKNALILKIIPLLEEIKAGMNKLLGERGEKSSGGVQTSTNVEEDPWTAFDDDKI
jgi:hypothetical protein